MSNQQDIQVMVLAAGKGTRMRSELPKVLHRVCGKTLLERTLRVVSELQPKRIVVVVGHGRELIDEELSELIDEETFGDVELVTAVQLEQKGTGDAVASGAENLSQELEQVLIVPGDVPLLTSETLHGLIQAYSKESSDSIGIITAFLEDASGFGRVVRNATGEVESIVEHRDCDAQQLEIGEINSSIYLLSRSFLEQALPTLKPHNAQGELYLTDVVGHAVKSGRKIVTYTEEEFTAVEGANTRAELARLEAIRRAEINCELMDSGVTLVDPLTTYIDEGVSIGPDSVIGPNTFLLGGTTIESGVKIAGSSFIESSNIRSGAHIKFSCVIEFSEVGKNSSVGPFAHLRAETELGESVKIGNFVETKKSKLSKGAKVNHLSYVGDTTVGEDANVGAGTITCNYDGIRKHQTVIEKGAFIGSNSSLIAPVTIGAGAIVGAGSAIAKDVPPGALGIERAKQVVVEGYAATKKSKSDKKS